MKNKLSIFFLFVFVAFGSKTINDSLYVKVSGSGRGGSVVIDSGLSVGKVTANNSPTHVLVPTDSVGEVKRCDTDSLSVGNSDKLDGYHAAYFDSLIAFRADSALARLYASLHSNDTVLIDTIPTGPTYHKLTCWNDISSELGYVADTANDQIIVTSVSAVFIYFHMPIYLSGGAGTTVYAAVFCNGVEVNEIHDEKKFQTINTRNSIEAMNNIVITEVPCTLDVRVRTDNVSDIVLNTTYGQFGAFAISNGDSVVWTDSSRVSDYSWHAYINSMQSSLDTILGTKADGTFYGITPANLRTTMGAASVTQVSDTLNGRISGTTNKLAMFTAANKVGNAPATVSGNNVTFTGNVSGDSAKFNIGKISKGNSSATAHPYPELIVEDSSYSGVQILTPNNYAGYVMFGDPEDDNAGHISYSHTLNRFEFRTNGTDRYFFDSSGNFTANGNINGDTGTFNALVLPGGNVQTQIDSKLNSSDFDDSLDNYIPAYTGYEGFIFAENSGLSNRLTESTELSHESNFLRIYNLQTLYRATLPQRSSFSFLPYTGQPVAWVAGRRYTSYCISRIDSTTAKTAWSSDEDTVDFEINSSGETSISKFCRTMSACTLYHNGVIDIDTAWREDHGQIVNIIFNRLSGTLVGSYATELRFDSGFLPDPSVASPNKLAASYSTMAGSFGGVIFGYCNIIGTGGNLIYLNGSLTGAGSVYEQVIRFSLR